jgi:hypothetical protein
MDDFRSRNVSPSKVSLPRRNIDAHCLVLLSDLPKSGDAVAASEIENRGASREPCQNLPQKS